MSVYDIYGNVISDGAENRYRTLETGDLATERPYWILHLDCGRKYFSVSNIKLMIDAMHTNGLNQLQLHFADDKGLRFALDDMTFIDVDGTSYDLSSCVSTTLGGSLSVADMDEIIVYARSKDIEIVPSLDMPGHMSAILTAFPALRYISTSPWTLNVKDDTAVKFALALVEKYANYFQSRGCRYWNIGADEVVFGQRGGRWGYADSDDIPYFVNFVNTIARYINSIGMIPRAFNDGVLYFGEYENAFDKNIEIYHWTNNEIMHETGIQSASALVQNGYRLINTSYYWYFIVPTCNSYTENTRVENANILKAFAGTTFTKDQDGACICVWCDNDTTADGGDAALSAILADIASLGIGIGLTTPNITYPIIRDT